MKVRISRRQSQLKSPVLEAFVTTASESLGPGRHEVITFTVHYQSIENGSLRKDSGKEPGDDLSEKIGRIGRSEA